MTLHDIGFDVSIRIHADETGRLEALSNRRADGRTALVVAAERGHLGVSGPEAASIDPLGPGEF